MHARVDFAGYFAGVHFDIGWWVFLSTSENMWGGGEGRWILLSMLISDLFPIDICSFSQLAEHKVYAWIDILWTKNGWKVIFTGFARWNIMFTGFTF